MSFTLADWFVNQAEVISISVSPAGRSMRIRRSCKALKSGHICRHIFIEVEKTGKEMIFSRLAELKTLGRIIYHCKLGVFDSQRSNTGQFFFRNSAFL